MKSLVNIPEELERTIQDLLDQNVLDPFLIVKAKDTLYDILIDKTARVIKLTPEQMRMTIVIMTIGPIIYNKEETPENGVLLKVFDEFADNILNGE
jgi:hypothetical protein